MTSPPRGGQHGFFAELGQFREVLSHAGLPILVGEFVAHDASHSVAGLGLRLGSQPQYDLPRPFCALSRLGHQPIAKRLHPGPPQGTLWIDHVIGEAGRQAEFEQPHQPA